MVLRRPLLTATSAASRRAPVANAFGSAASKMPTSGMPIPVCWDRRWTVLTSQLSVSLAGRSITCTRMARFAIDFDSASEISAPLKPMTAEKISSDVRLSPEPCASSRLSIPNSRSTMPSRTTIARLVARNRITRFMRRAPQQDGSPHA
jgi:hypothetical protein